MDQEQLSRIFAAAENHRLNDTPQVEGWGSNVDQDNDYLWNITEGMNWERPRPDGVWRVVPPLGSDHA